MKMSENEFIELQELLPKGSLDSNPSETQQNKNDCVITMESDSENEKLNYVKDSVNLLNSKELRVKVCVIK